MRAICKGDILPVLTLSGSLGLKTDAIEAKGLQGLVRFHQISVIIYPANKV